MKRIGITKLEFFYLVIFKELQTEPQHPAAMFRKLESEYLTPQLSRTQFYRAIKRMDEEFQWIESISPESEKKKVFRLTDRGVEKQNWFFQRYYEKLQSIYPFIQGILQDIENPNIALNTTSLNKEFQVFSSRLLSVKELIWFHTFRFLQSNDELVGADLLEFFQSRFGWQPNERYLYDVLHDMEEKGWILGKWKGKRRYKMYYTLQPDGKHIVINVRERVVTQLKDSLHLIVTILKTFH